MDALRHVMAEGFSFWRCMRCDLARLTELKQLRNCWSEIHRDCSFEQPFPRRRLHRSKKLPQLRKNAVSASGRFVPQSVSSTDLSCCALHERPIFPPRGSTEFYADAAFSTLRAHTARKSDSQVGFSRHLSCADHERLVQETAPFAATHTNW